MAGHTGREAAGSYRPCGVAGLPVRRPGARARTCRCRPRVRCSSAWRRARPAPSPSRASRRFGTGPPRPRASRAAAGAGDQSVRRVARQGRPLGDAHAGAARHHRSRQQLSLRPAGAFRPLRPGRPRRPPLAGRLLHFQAGPRALRIRRPEPDRVDRRRTIGGGARPQSGDAGRLSAVADAAALPALRPRRPDERHASGRRSMSTTSSSPWWSRKKTASSAPAG